MKYQILNFWGLMRLRLSTVILLENQTDWLHSFSYFLTSSKIAFELKKTSKLDFFGGSFNYTKLYKVTCPIQTCTHTHTHRHTHTHTHINKHKWNTTHVKNIHLLMTEINKVLNGLSPPIISGILKKKWIAHIP